MVARPKTATASSIRRPVGRMSGRWVGTSAIASAPGAGMLRSAPNPTGPASRMSRA
jgi:hypothetical protein